MVNRSTPDQFQLRLPPGLRERIKAYADRHGRSMNAEIVRVLENEFPEPWSIENRVRDLLDLLDVVKVGASNEAISIFVDEVDETVRGMIAGRVGDLDEKQRAAIADHFAEYDLKRAADGDRTIYNRDLDDEEVSALEKTGNTQKFTHKRERE